MIFIEIGAHYGQPNEVAKHLKYSFNDFWLFEPSTAALKRLSDITDTRLKIFPIGLAAKNYSTSLYKPRVESVTIFREKFASDTELSSQKINVKKASEISDRILSDNIIFIKNCCEGSETDILKDLLEFSFLNETYSTLVDFDTYRIKKNYAIENSQKKLELCGGRFYNADFFGAKHSDANVKSWLNHELESNFVKFTLKEHFSFKLRLHLPFKRRIILIFTPYVPVKYKSKMSIYFNRYTNRTTLSKYN